MNNKECLILVGSLAFVFIIAIICWKKNKKSTPLEPPLPPFVPPPPPPIVPPMHQTQQTQQMNPPQTFHDQKTSLIDQQYGGEAQYRGAGLNPNSTQSQYQGMGSNPSEQNYQSYNDGDPRTNPLGVGPGVSTEQPQHTYL